MIRINIQRSDKGRIRAFSSKGHAGFAEKGSDVVCAAVSVLVINTINSIEVLLPEDAFRMKTETDEKKGYIRCVFSGEPSEEAGLLLDAMYLGLKDIERSYGGDHISIAEEGEKRL